MEIKYKNIVLRDMKIPDTEDKIRWNTVETDWANWDAPWETLEDIKNFDAEKFRKKALEKLKEPEDEIRFGFEIDTEKGEHIGSINSYFIDEEYNWISLKDAKPEQKLFRTVGLAICESSFCGKGLGTNALAAFIKYYLDNGETEIYTQTWSGNIRMIKCAEKLGFYVCKRKVGIRKVRGGIYDGLTFRLDTEKFNSLMNSGRI